jgi:hypothetical protein
MDLVMRGTAIMNRARQGEDLSEARRLFQEAIRLDANMAAAWEGLAGTFFLNSRFSPSREEDLRQAGEAVKRALALDPVLGEEKTLRGGFAERPLVGRSGELGGEAPVTERGDNQPAARVGGIRLGMAGRAERHQAVAIEVRAPLGALDDVVDLEGAPRHHGCALTPLGGSAGQALAQGFRRVGSGAARQLSPSDHSSTPKS